MQQAIALGYEETKTGQLWLHVIGTVYAASQWLWLQGDKNGAAVVACGWTVFCMISSSGVIAYAAYHVLSRGTPDARS